MSSSKRWLAEHVQDCYVQKARQEGYISRAAYKLMDLDCKDRFFKPAMLVVDLGAAPGGWSQFSVEKVGAAGKVIALDLLPMLPVSGVEFIQGDFTDAAVFQTLLERISQLSANNAADMVLSDMAPNLSGQMSIDQPRSMALVELAFDCALQVLKPGGAFVVKVFQGSGVDALIKQLRTHFRTVNIRKPKASRPRSREIYLVALGFLSNVT